MILVATGYFVPFVRLFEAVDAYAAASGEHVLVQGLKSPYTFTAAEHQEFLTNMPAMMKSADLVITHGAMSLTEAIDVNGRVVVAPRQHRYGEHIDDHQVEFSQWQQSIYGFPLVLDMADLTDAIETARHAEPLTLDTSRRDRLVGFMQQTLTSWNST